MYTTNYFNLSRGVRQGCPLSPYLFILAAEILSTAIRSDKDIKGIKINNDERTEMKTSQFADDTCLILKNEKSLTPLFEMLGKFA